MIKYQLNKLHEQLSNSLSRLTILTSKRCCSAPFVIEMSSFFLRENYRNEFESSRAEFATSQVAFYPPLAVCLLPKLTAAGPAWADGLTTSSCGLVSMTLWYGGVMAWMW